MAFVSWERHANGSTGSATYGGFPQWITHYTIVSNSVEDQWPTALAYFEANVARRGQQYTQQQGTKYGANDPDMAAICTAINGQPIAGFCGPAYKWTMQATWSLNTPVNFEAQFSSSTTVLRDKVVDNAFYVPTADGYASGGITNLETTTPAVRIPITNATERELYEDPPVSEPEYGERFQIGLTLGSYNHAVQRGFRGTINDADLQLNTLNFFSDYPKWTLLLTGVDFTLRTVEIDGTTGNSAQQVYDVLWTFDYDPAGHVRILQNKGFYRLLDSPAPPYMERYKTPSGKAYESPQPLNALGEAKLDGDGNPVPAQQWEDVSWRVADDSNFFTIPGVGSLFTSPPPP